MALTVYMIVFSNSSLNCGTRHYQNIAFCVGENLSGNASQHMLRHSVRPLGAESH